MVDVGSLGRAGPTALLRYQSSRGSSSANIYNLLLPACQGALSAQSVHNACPCTTCYSHNDEGRLRMKMCSSLKQVIHWSDVLPSSGTKNFGRFPITPLDSNTRRVAALLANLADEHISSNVLSSRNMTHYDGQPQLVTSHFYCVRNVCVAGVNSSESHSNGWQFRAQYWIIITKSNPPQILNQGLIHLVSLHPSLSTKSDQIIDWTLEYLWHQRIHQ